MSFLHLGSIALCAHCSRCGICYLWFSECL